jgi:2-dehydro-3-deoxyglucarate aldolase/4-hydroxy-2-oxoheptanedioate aldolase
MRGVAGSPRAAGYGQSPKDYLTKANDEILVIVAVETPEAISRLERILEVPGVDGIFIGPMDLSTSMGHPFDPGHPEVQAAMAAIEARVLAANKALGTVATSWEQARGLYQKGYQMVTLMADGVALGKLAAETAGKFRTEFPDR